MRKNHQPPPCCIPLTLTWPLLALVTGLMACGADGRNPLAYVEEDDDTPAQVDVSPGDEDDGTPAQTDDIPAQDPHDEEAEELGTSEEYEPQEDDNAPVACEAGYVSVEDVCVPTCAVAALDCGAHGTCDDSLGAPQCACDDGYSGVLCESCVGESCPSAGCANSAVDCGTYGVCDDSFGEATCVCHSGYDGEHCQFCDTGFVAVGSECVPSCAMTGLVCGANGSCTEGPSGAYCQCEAGYSGPHCTTCATDYFWLGGECVDQAVVKGIVDAVAQEEMVQQNLQGLAVGVILGGELAYVGGYGFADFENNKPVTPQTLFRWASLSKPLTAAAALRMWEQGHVDLEADIRTYVPSWPIKPQGPITLRDLLTNQGGVGHYSQLTLNMSAYDPTAPYDPEGTIDIFKNNNLLFTPGTDYHYTTFGFNLASAVLHSAAKTAFGASSGYPEAVHALVAAPLGMSTLQPDYSEFKDIPGRVAGYRRTCSQTILREGTTDVSFKLGGGGWISSTEDLARFAAGLLRSQVLSEETQTMMFTAAPDANDKTYGYGFGVATTLTNPPLGPHTRVSHSGGQENTSTYLLLYPGQDLGIVFMSNSTYVDRLRIVRRVANAFGRNWSISPFSMHQFLGCNGGCSGKSTRNFSGIWSPGSKPTVFRRGYNHEGFLRERNRLRSLGWVAVDFETYVDGSGVRRWDGVFKQLDIASAMWRNFTTDGFAEKWQEMSNDGYRLMDLETYTTTSGERRWAGLFVQGSGAYALWRNASAGSFATKVDELAASGLALVDVETYVDGGQRRWAGVWRAGPVNQKFVRDLTQSEFADVRTQLGSEGYRLVDIEAYSSGGTKLWAGVFHAATHAQALQRNWDYCGFLERHEHWASQGLELIDYEFHD